MAVAQLVRASDCDSECRGFEPHSSPHNGCSFGAQVPLRHHILVALGSNPKCSPNGFKCLRVPQQKLWPKSSNWKREQANMVIVAQWLAKALECLTVNQEVVGSIPIFHPKGEAEVVNEAFKWPETIKLVYSVKA